MEYGDGFSTTFWQDFSIADMYGMDAVRDTYERAMNEWRDQYRYLTDLVMVLNHKIWQHHESNQGLAQLYNELWMKAEDYALTNLKGDELQYYFRVTD